MWREVETGAERRRARVNAVGWTLAFATVCTVAIIDVVVVLGGLGYLVR